MSLNLSTLEVIATELAEIKARQQAMNALILVGFEHFGEWAASLKDEGKFTQGTYAGKYVEFYEHFLEQYKQENMDALRFAIEDSEKLAS